MKLRAQGAFLNSRHGRRTFATFFVIVAAPLLTVTYLSYELTELILRRSTAQLLQEATKSMSLNLIDRMRNAESLLLAAAEESPGASANSALRARMAALFSYVGRTDTEPGDSAAIRAGTRPLSRLRVVRPSPDRSPTVELTVWSTSGARLTGRLNPDFLWENLQSAIYNVCMEGPGFGSRFCQRSEPVSPHDVSIERQVFFRPYLEAEGWTLTTIAAPTVADFLPMSIGNMLGTVAGLAFLLALMASSFFVRKSTRPLDALVTGTRLLREGDFSHAVPLEGMADEFRELAVSFNAMAADVGADLRFMQVLANIDQSILNRRPLSDVMELSLSHLHATSPELAVAVVSWDQADLLPKAYRIGVDATLQSETVSPDGLETGPSGQPVPRLPVDSGRQRWRHMPVARTDDKAVWLRLEEHPAQPAAARRHLNELVALSGRLAVAIHADQREQLLIARAARDSLTGLLNRLGLVEAIDSLVADPAPSLGFAVAYLDLDGFKDVNDAYGHDVGDRLLKAVAQRVAISLQPAPLALARLGGDEFVFVIPADENGEYLRRIDAVLQEIQPIYVIDGTEILIGGSIGIAMHPDHGINHDELLRNADLAMYAAKGSGRNRVVEFEIAFNSAAAERVELRRDLGSALAEGQLFVVYQARVDANTKQTHSVEALLRWRHPRQGLVSPDKFITLAEEAGLIVEIGLWVMEQAFVQFNAWKAEARLQITQISVNLSPVQMTHSSFLDDVERLMLRHSIPRGAIELEVTEGALIRDVDTAIQKLAHLQKLGFDIALDDFGMGYSAMSYLSVLPFNTLKIDKSFVWDFNRQKSAYAIAAAIVALAKALDKRIVAEGVETEEQALLLQRLGVDELQGYLYSKPLPPNMF
jgi:diguanylate cyclase (GGDEF)-like protein